MCACASEGVLNKQVISLQFIRSQDWIISGNDLTPVKTK